MFDMKYNMTNRYKKGTIINIYLNCILFYTYFFMTKKQKLYEKLLQQINKGDYQVNEALPSIRNASILFDVSKNTVVDAYEKLKDDGIIRSLPGSGHYVTTRHYNEHYKNLSSNFIRAVDTIELLQEQLLQRHAYRPGDGRYPRDWMHQLKLNQYMGNTGKIFNDLRNATEYGQPQGLAKLIDSLCDRLSLKQIAVTPPQCLLTAGANQALDLVIRHFLEEGDHVIIESPGYYPLFSKLFLQKVRKHSIERHTWGYDLNKLSSLCKTWKPKLFFLQPSVHNPTGTTLNIEQRQSILDIAKRHNVLLIEEDPFSDIYSNLPPSLMTLSQGKNIIYIGTFSKTMTSSLRCGYILSNQEIIKSLLTLKIVTLVNTSAIIETIVFDIIDSGKYDLHLKSLSSHLDESRKNSLKQLQKLPFMEITGNTHGFYLWCTLPLGIDDIKLAEEAHKNNIFLSPGRLFMHEHTPYAAFRMNVAYSQEKKILDFLYPHLHKR